ncbi:MAG: pseudouridine-5-phosphate glycosidase [Acidiferrobacteraceae bacterium]|nr:pseudouridine-5-phosphate glycosidase [Acidiferrobacteraceae bacterium]|tara:strand:- start:846 stop:1757 length:912 start_codon:yes stop_codon:yes gene_type:complete
MNSFVINDEVKNALANNQPVVALESTLISHGLPKTDSLRVARLAEAAIRASGAIPATIAVSRGKVLVGLSDLELDHFANTDNNWKLSTDNIATAIVQEASGGTTVSATMICAHLAGIHVFATGGIGGVHHGWQSSLDISSDLTQLSRTPVTVVCSGAKSILDLPATVEKLETLGVPIIGLATKQLPAFFSQESGLVLRQTAVDVEQAAKIITTRRSLRLVGGEILAVPVPRNAALPWTSVQEWVSKASAEANKKQLTGSLVTPFILQRLRELSDDQTLNANIALIENNASIAGHLAIELILNT